MSLNFNTDVVGTVEKSIYVDTDVAKVLHFMLDNIQARKLVAVSEQVAQLAPLMWGHMERKELYPISFFNFSLPD